MKLVRSSISIAIWIFFCLSQVWAQNGSFPWALGAGTRMIQYQAHPGDPKLQHPYYDPTIQLQAIHYLNGAFDFRTQLTIGPNVRMPGGETSLRGNLIDMNYMLTFKLHNGVLLRESALVSPYFLVGVGGSYLPNRPDAYLPFGGGLRVRFGPRMSLQLETTRQVSLNRDYQTLAHAIAFVYNLDTKEQRKPEEIEQDTSLQQFLMATLPSDRDGDQVLDQEDRCPDTPGLLEYQGCMEEPAYDPEIRVADATPTPQAQPVTLAEGPTLAQEATEPAMSRDEDTEESVVVATPESAPLAGPKPVLTPADTATWVALSSPDDQTRALGHLSALQAQEPASTETELWVPEVEEEEAAPSVAVSSEAAAEVAPAEEQLWLPGPDESQPDPVASETALVQRERPEEKPANLLTDEVRQTRALAPIFFEYGSDQLTPEAKQVLDDLAATLKADPLVMLRIQGHTDDRGGEDTNLVLSVMRAYHVKYYLVHEHGIRQTRITSNGVGESQPLADNDDPASRMRNRRVDFQLMQ